MEEDYDKHVKAVQFLKRAQAYYEEGSYEKMAEPLQECLNLDGSLTLGTWQQIVFIECDTRDRSRKLVVQVIGE